MTAAFANRALRISIGGATPDVKLARCAASAFVRQTLNAPSLAEVVFAEPPSVRDLKIGTGLTFGLDANITLFDGEITTIEHQRDGSEGHVVRVRAYDRLHRLRKKQRARVLKDVTASDIAGELAGALGLEHEAAEPGPSRRFAVQTEQSDFEFLLEAASGAGLHVYLDDGTLKLLTLAGEGDAIELKHGRDLANVRSVASAETLRRFTKIRAWDVLHTKLLDETVSLARQDAEEMHSAGQDAFGDIGQRTLFNRVAPSAAETEGFAQADIDRAVQGELIIEGKADGNPEIRPGRAVNIVGVDDDVDGRFTVTQALHRFTEEAGYFTDFSTAPPPRPARCSGPVFTYGVVSDVDDPDRLSRIRAQLPLLGDLESDWMPVMMMGAGKSKGFAVLPEIEDTILIVFPDGNPASGIVLGGLYGENSAPGLVASGARPFVLSTANGQVFMLDAANALASLVTSGGDRFELGPKGSHLFATQDLLIEAPGRTLTIRAKAVEFEEG
jgi:phage baseplate assembly protein gpV/phage protein D